jgi:CrcB protein
MISFHYLKYLQSNYNDLYLCDELYVFYNVVQLIMIKTMLLIGTGGFLGSISRFLASRFMQDIFPSAFPFGTFFVNISGCLLIGLIYGFSERSSLLTSGWKMFLAVGFCGGFTTFSTFANENLALLRDGAYFYFSLYTGLSVFLGIAATFFGVLLTKIL